MDICTARHHSSLFRVHPERQEMSAYISDLEANTTGRVFDRVYDDACDEGLAIVSSKTGHMATFHFQEHRRDEEGELLAWTFVPTRTTLVRFPQLKDWKVTVLND